MFVRGHLQKACSGIQKQIEDGMSQDAFLKVRKIIFISPYCLKNTRCPGFPEYFHDFQVWKCNGN